MTELSKIQELVDEELKEANKKYPLFSSDHEAYAVIMEELEETEENVNSMGYCATAMWAGVKRNKSVKNNIEGLKDLALKTAAEAIQVAAMCDKFMMNKDTYLNGWIKCKDLSKMTPENICGFCSADPEECGKNHQICYNAVMRESK